MYNHAPADYQCPFCLLIAGIENERVISVASDLVCQDTAVTAFISAHSWGRNLGHVIVVPTQHYENIYDLPLDVATAIHAVARNVALAMKRAYKCDGISTRQHNEPTGNQDVWHYHLHVLPRYQSDNFYQQGFALMPALERAKYAARLKAALKTDL